MWWSYGYRDVKAIVSVLIVSHVEAYCYTYDWLQCIVYAINSDNFYVSCEHTIYAILALDFYIFIIEVRLIAP